MTSGEHLEAIRRLLRLADAYALAELVVEESGLKVTIRGGDGEHALRNLRRSLAQPNREYVPRRARWARHLRLRWRTGPHRALQSQVGQ